MHLKISLALVLVAFCVATLGYDPDFSKRKSGDSKATVAKGSISAANTNIKGRRTAQLEGRGGQASVKTHKGANLNANKGAAASSASTGSKRVSASKSGSKKEVQTGKGKNAEFAPAQGSDTSAFEAAGRKKFQGKMQKVDGQKERRIIVNNSQKNKATKYQYKKDGTDGVVRALDHGKEAHIDNLSKKESKHTLDVRAKGADRGEADKTVVVQKSETGWDGIVPVKVNQKFRGLIPSGLAQPYAHVSGRKEKERGQVVSKTFLSPRAGFLGNVPDFESNKPASKAVGIAKSDNSATVGTALNSRRDPNNAFETKFDQGREVECVGNFDNQNNKASGGFVHKNLKVKYVNPTGGSAYEFPGCFDITADITIPAGFSMKDLAMSLFVFSPTCGQLKCGSGSSCNGLDCFLESICQAKPASGNKNGDDIGNYILSKTTSDLCDLPVSSSATQQKLEVRYCPDEEATTSFRKACDTIPFIGAPKGGNKKHSVVVQANIYEKKPDFTCNRGIFSKKDGIGGNIVKRACKEYHVDFGVSKKSVRKDNHLDAPNCKGKFANHPMCAGLYSQRG